MRKRCQVLGVLALLLMPAASCWGQTAEAGAQQPAVAYVAGGSLYLATESGKVVRQIDVPVPMGDFAISPDLTWVVFATAISGTLGGPFLILDVASGAIDTMMPDPYFNGTARGDLAEFYTDPEFSPDGKSVVFATHAHGEGNDLQLSGPLALLNLQTREVSIVKSTVYEDGLPLGYIRDPHWSPDGKQILGTVEGRIFLTGADGQALSELTIPESGRVYAIGWFGTGCILYHTGEEAERSPAWVFRLNTRTASLAGAMLGLGEDELRGLRGIAEDLRMFSDPDGYRVDGPGGSWLIHGSPETTFARLLPQTAGATQVPADCR
jgi:hypothetical protein